jgi:hypothetical protein
MSDAGVWSNEKKGNNIASQPARTPRAGGTSRFVYRLLNKILLSVLGRNAGVAALEYAASVIPALGRVYCGTREPLVRAECDYFLTSDVLDFQCFHQVVMVGGGAVPVTAMHWAARFDGPVVVLEKSRLATMLCKRYVRKRGFQNIQVLCLNGKAYEEYDNSIVLCSLHVTKKTCIVRKLLADATGKSIIFVRISNGEQLGTGAVNWHTVAEFRNFKVLVTTTGQEQ